MSTVRRVRAALMRRSFAEFGDRALQAGRAALERAGMAPDTAAPTATAWRAELHDDAGRPFANAQAALADFRARASTRFLAGTADVAATVAVIRAVDPAAESRTIALANATASGRHRLLGFPAIDFGTPPDWHLDPCRGKRAPLAHWSRIAYLDENVVGDHKVIWELNRHQWLVHLAKAHHFTRDERWAEMALAHIDAWIEANPCKRGINWASSLEIALRAIAWLWVLFLLRDADSLTAPRFARMMRVLAVGGRHVERHLSTWFSPNTHLTGEALGLLYLGCALPALIDAPRWRELGMRILARHIPEHVRADGTYVEQSTHYARYTADFLVHAVALCGRSGIDAQPLIAALQRGATFLRHVARPDGTIPLIGDDDGGRVLFLDPAPADDVGPTLAVAATMTGDATLALPGVAPSEEIAWLLGGAALRRAVETPTLLPAGGSRLFADGGFATLRDGWGAAASLAVFDCGPHGMGNGGHAHADLGSIDLTLRGRAVVSDPGTWSYLTGGGERDRFRNAAAHAVPIVDGQGSAEPGTAFSWDRIPRVLARSAQISADCDIVAFSHDGFLHLEDPVAHRRALLRMRHEYWLVIDTFRSARRHDVSISYPLAPGLRAHLDGTRAVIAASHGDVARFVTSAAEGGWRLDEAWSSNAYARREPSFRLVQDLSLAGDLVVATLVQPAAEPAILSVQFAHGGDASLLVIERATGARDFLRMEDASCSLTDSDGRRTECAWPALRTNPGAA